MFSGKFGAFPLRLPTEHGTTSLYANLATTSAECKKAMDLLSCNALLNSALRGVYYLDGRIWQFRSLGAAVVEPLLR